MLPSGVILHHLQHDGRGTGSVDHDPGDGGRHRAALRVRRACTAPRWNAGARSPRCARSARGAPRVLGIVLLGVREDQPHVRRVIPERPAATKLLREVPQKQPAFLDQRLRVADHIDIFLFARPKNHCWTRRGCRSEATPRTTTACNSAFLNPRSSSRPSTRVFFFETTLPMVAPVSEITDGQKIAAEVNLRQLKKLARSAGPDERLTALYDAGRQSLIIRSESSSASPLRRHFEARGGGELAQRYQLRVGRLASPGAAGPDPKHPPVRPVAKSAAQRRRRGAKNSSQVAVRSGYPRPHRRDLAQGPVCQHQCDQASQSIEQIGQSSNHSSDPPD